MSKKSGKKIYGAILTAAEKTAMDLEIKKEIAEFERQHAIETCALILYVLNREFGFGPKRLRTFYDHFDAALKRLLDHYETEDSDEAWLCTRKLKEIGVDIEAWAKENQAK